MTDRVRTLTVILDKDYRDDDVESIVHAISSIRGVDRVETRVVQHEDHIARRTVAAAMKNRMLEAVYDVFDPNKPL